MNCVNIGMHGATIKIGCKVYVNVSSNFSYLQAIDVENLD